MKKLLLYTLSLLLCMITVAQEFSPDFELSNQSVLENDDFLMKYQYNLIWDYSESVWEHHRFITIEYNEYNNPTEKYEKRTEGSADIYYTGLGYDNNQNLEVETKYERIDDAWIEYSNTLYYYEGNNRVQKISKRWDGEQYVNDIKNTYGYDANDKKISQMMYYWEEGKWVESVKFDFQYDGNNLYKVLSEARIEDAWVNSQKSIYTYDTSNNNLLNIKTSNWDSEISSWTVPSMQQNYTYDPDNNQIIFIFQQWNEYDGVWYNLYKSDYYYLPIDSETVENQSSDINKTIDDFQTTEDDIVIDPGREGKTLIGVEVLLDSVLHSSVSDLEFTLMHNGITETIINHAGGDGDNFFGTKLSDRGVESIANGIAPFYGIYIPENPLSTFLENDPAGTWTLSIYDGAEGNTGTLQSWGLVLIYASSSSVEDGIIDISEMMLFPNPASDKISLQSAVFNQQPAFVEIFDLNGKRLLEWHIPRITTSAEINVSEFKNGIYFCKISSGKYSTTKKLIIQK